MPQVLIVNPSERKGKKMAKRTAAQQRATRKMIAANRARAKGVSRAKPRRRATPRAAPAPAARRRKSAPRRARPQVSAAQATRAGRTLRYRRRNPVGFNIAGFVTNTLMPSAIGGAGALALDVLVGMLPLPPALKTGPMAPVMKVAGAIGLGMAAGMFASRKTAEQIAAGAVTVTLYGLAKTMLIKISGGKIPGLAEYVEMYPGGPMGQYMDEYTGQNEGEVPMIGYMSPGEQVGHLMPEGVEGYETGVYR